VLSVLLLGVAGFLIAHLVPADVLSRSRLARYLVSAVSVLLPLEEYARRTPWPDIAKLYYSVVWLAFPFALAGTWEIFRARDGKTDGLLFRPKERLGLPARLGLVALVPLWLLLAYVGLWYWGGDTRLVAFSSSLWQMSLLGILAPVLTALALAMGLGSLVKALLGRFP
jgi:hypothetical protein